MKNFLFPQNGHVATDRQQRGGTLIEALIAVLLFSIGVLGLIGLQSKAIGMSNDVDDRNRAALLADEVIAYMWQIDSVSIGNGDMLTWKSKVQTQLPNGAYEIKPVSGKAKTADVVITWYQPARGASDPDQLSTRVTLTGPDL